MGRNRYSCPVSPWLLRPRFERRLRRFGRWVPVVLLVALGWVLVIDRPGLRTEYFALGAPWEGRPVHTTVGEPGLEGTTDVSAVLVTDVVFSVRWSGWWSVADGGEHAFAMYADDGGFLRIDGEVLVDTRGLFGERRRQGRRVLARGFHAIEIGYYQTHGESRLAIDWQPAIAAGVAAGALPRGDLFARGPLMARRIVRRALAGVPEVHRRLLGVLLLLAAGLIVVRPGAVPVAWGARFLERFSAISPGKRHAAFLLVLVAVAFLASFPFTGSVRGGDDTAYLNAAHFGEKEWFVNRYLHVYLLKLSGALSGGDPLLGGRVWWSFAFAVTVGSLAVAIRSVGPGLQARTLAVTLFILLGQTAIFGLVGAAFADYTAMMFVTAAVAVLLHGVARSGEGRWHAFAIGALTVAAFRSKEVGAVLLCLPLLFLIGDRGLELRRFARRLAFWGAGAVAVVLVLVLFDGWILGEFLFSFDSERLARLRGMNLPQTAEPRRMDESWLGVIWHSGRFSAGLSLRYVWVGALVGAIVAGLRQRRLELRLLHLLPVAYLLALIALYVRMPHPFSERMLIPILPTACLMTGLILHYAGLDEVPWRTLLAPGILIPVVAGAALLFGIVIPYRLGQLEATEFLPAAMVGSYGWPPDAFAVGVLLPAVVLLALSWLALSVNRPGARLAALLVVVMALFGLGFEFNRSSLSKRLAVQKAELLLYPWQVFGERLARERPRTIALSSDLQSRYRMSAATRSALARLALRRRDVEVELFSDLPDEVDAVIASREIYRQWRKQAPALAATAMPDPAGLLYLMFPGEAAGSLKLPELPERPEPASRP